MIRKIIDTKNPMLREKSKVVAKIDKKIVDLGKDLIDTLKVQKDPQGVGLAAVQIGKLLRMFAMEYKNGIKVVVNPEVIPTPTKDHRKLKTTKSKKKKRNSILEGCLSVPYFYGPLIRRPEITLKYYELDGKEVVETFYDFPAQIVQHEMDHLDGVLFTDHIIEEKKPLYKIDPHTDEWEEVEIE